MSDRVSRRRLLGWAGAAGTAGVAAGVLGERTVTEREPSSTHPENEHRTPASERVIPTEPGGLPHGLADPVPAFGHVLAVDLADDVRGSARASRRAARELLTQWSRMTDSPTRLEDGSAALDVGAATLQVAVGVGASLLRWCGLEAKRPEAFVDLPSFVTDELRPDTSGGDLVVHVGAEDPMRLAGAIQSVVSGLGGRARVRWSRSGFRQTQAAVDRPGQTPRNLMGHRDGTNNPDRGSPLWESAVRVREPTGPGAWLDGGSYLVVRDIRIDLHRWFAESPHARDGVIGRHTDNGAPFGGEREDDPVGLTLQDRHGDPVVPAHAHIRLASSTNTAGSRIYRRSWNYDDGWTSAGERDAGLLFLAWQADPRRGFIPIQRSLVEGDDALNRYTTHVGSAVFAMLPQPQDSASAGRALLGGDA